jgi:peptidoglycan hydrolase CwlO-like protein
MEILKELEEKVKAAGEQLDALRKQNRSLKTKVKKLEAEVAESAGSSEWQGERDAIRERVTKLAGDLESLLQG